MERPSGLRYARGFTVVELVIAMAIFGIVVGVAVPKATESARIARVDRAARIVAVDLEQSLSLAARQRSPVQIQQPDGTLRIEVSSIADGTVFSTTELGQNLRVGVSVDDMTLDPATVSVFPTGLTSAPLTVTLESGDHQRTITMSQAGQIRVF